MTKQTTVSAYTTKYDGGTSVLNHCLQCTIHSYPFINATCQNARMCITYSDIRELYELKKLIYICTLRIVNMLVQLNRKTRQKLYITGKSSNAIKTTVKT